MQEKGHVTSRAVSGTWQSYEYYSLRVVCKVRLHHFVRDKKKSKSTGLMASHFEYLTYYQRLIARAIPEKPCLNYLSRFCNFTQYYTCLLLL